MLHRGQLSYRFIATTTICAAILCTSSAHATLISQVTHDKFQHAGVQKDDNKAPKEVQRCFKLIEDEETESGKALKIRLSKPLIRKEAFHVLTTPGDRKPLPTGVYKATVRMKAQGMLNTLGSSIIIKAGDRTREVWMNEFEEEDTYQEFTVLFESRPGHIITKGSLGSWGAPGGAGVLVDRKELPNIKKNLERNSAPWLERASMQLANKVLVRDRKKDTSKIAELTEKIKKAITDCGPDGLVYDESIEPEKQPFKENVVKLINEEGASRPNGSVSLSFPMNTTGQGRSSTRGASTPQPTLRHLTVDWIKIESVDEPDHIVMRTTTCRFPWRRPGQEQVFNIWMHNRSGKAQSAKLRLVLRSGLKHEEILWEKPLELQNGQYESLVWRWKIPLKQRPWGQTIIGQIVKDGKVVSEDHAWFTIHHFSNAVMISNRGNTRRFYHLYGTAPRTQNHQELIGANCTIYDSAGVVPDPDEFFDPYVVGNGTFFTSIPALASWTMGLSMGGVAPFFYLESNGSAKRALEIYWDHPDWVPKAPGNMDSFLINRDKTAKEWLEWYHADPRKRKREAPSIARAGGAYSGQLVGLNGIVKENVDRVIEGSIKLCDNTSFYGVRWDGLPFRAFNSKSLGGNWGKTKEELDAISMANIRRYRKELRAVYPNFELRANGGLVKMEEKQEDPYDFDKAFEILKSDPIHLALLEGHGSVMEEIWMSYAHFGNYANNCLNYLRVSHFENAAYKMAGGHNGHMLWFYDGKTQYTPDELYQQLFTFLGGAHLDGAFGPIVESVHELGVYAMRFGEYFWDPALRPIYDMVDKVEIDAEADLWCTETGFEKTTEDGSFIYIIPVINPPVTELWHQNRFGLLPDPITEPIGLTVQIPEGYSGVKAVYLLENSPYPHVKQLEFEDEETEVYFELPELVVFEVAVVEFEKE